MNTDWGDHNTFKVVVDYTVPMKMDLYVNGVKSPLALDDEARKIIEGHFPPVWDSDEGKRRVRDGGDHTGPGRGGGVVKPPFFAGNGAIVGGKCTTDE